MASHYFFCANGELLTRWREALPSARAVRLDAPTAQLDNVQLAWVRLPREVPIAEAIAHVRAAVGEVPIIVLSDQPGDDEALGCFGAGAKGYCNTHAVPELLQRVAQVVLQGGLWIGESLMQRLLQGTAHLPTPSPAEAGGEWIALLTERERQVALAVAGGASNKEIARQLGITERTIKAHTGAIFSKLDVRDRLQLSLLIHGRPVR
jgi:two-component system, NarL family, nitrate/nitrite response regulator NarL